jgi:dTMP kinase
VRGRFIVFEGIEGSGKSTQAERLAASLGALLTREPGGTALGEKLRAHLLESTEAIDPYAELLMMVAARAQHVAEKIEPALIAGRDVVCDRYDGSTLAYQGFGRGLDLSAVRRACELANHGLAPDLVVLLDLPLEIAFARLSQKRDRFESEGRLFHQRIADGYRALAVESNWAVVDARGDLDEVSARVRQLIEERIGR